MHTVWATYLLPFTAQHRADPIPLLHVTSHVPCCVSRRASCRGAAHRPGSVIWPCVDNGVAAELQPADLELELSMCIVQCVHPHVLGGEGEVGFEFNTVTQAASLRRWNIYKAVCGSSACGISQGA